MITPSSLSGRRASDRPSCACPVLACERCGCHETVLPRPDWLPQGERVNGVPVDACIADRVLALWSAGLHTRGSCCGHGKCAPSIVIPEAVPAEPYVRLLGPDWTIYQWQLVPVVEGSARIAIENDDSARSF